MATESMFVYILASRTRRLYVGVTNDLVRRVWEHKTGLVAGFTRRYGINQLVYFESIKEASTAIQREKQIKSYARVKKLALIASMNPDWDDLQSPGMRTSGGPIPRSARDDAP